MGSAGTKFLRCLPNPYRIERPPCLEDPRPKGAQTKRFAWIVIRLIPIFRSLLSHLLRRESRFIASPEWGLNLGAGSAISPGFHASVAGHFGVD